MIPKTIKIATRQSPLALCQAKLVKNQLQRHYPEMQISLLPLITTGDKFLDNHLAKIGGKGLFVKELEQALLDGRADIAVHSMKDVPSIIPPQLELAIICTRTEPRDAFLSYKSANLLELPQNAIVGTSSLRRQCQIKATRPDLQVKSLRGNINTRLNQLANGNFDAIVLAAAGLQRLNLEQHIRSMLSLEQCLPAAGQGALGIECRQDAFELKKLLTVLADPITTACITAERRVIAVLGGGCETPLAAYCHIDEQQQLSLRSMVGSPQGDIIIYAHQKGAIYAPEQLGQDVARSLLDQGAAMILGVRSHE